MVMGKLFFQENYANDYKIKLRLRLFLDNSSIGQATCGAMLNTCLQGRNEGERGAIPRATSRHGAPNHCGRRRKIPTMSQVLSSLQCICFRKTTVSNMGAPNLLLAPGAI